MPPSALSKLPPELLQVVIDYLSTKDRISLSLTGGGWDRIARTMFWQKLDFEFGFGKDVDIQIEIKPYLSITNYGIRELKIKGTSLRGDWKELGLDRCRGLRQLSVGFLLENLPNLSEDDTSFHFPELKNLNLEGCFDTDFALRFLHICPQLETARFAFCGRNGQGPAPNPLNSITGKETIPAGLKSLTLAATGYLEARFPENAVKDPPALEELKVIGVHSAVKRDFIHLTKLRKLSILRCDDLSYFHGPPSLQELGIPLDKMDTGSTFTPMPDLRELEVWYLGGAPENTARVLHNLLEGLTDGILRKLKLQERRDLLLDDLPNHEYHNDFYTIVQEFSFLRAKLRNVTKLFVSVRGWINGATLQKIAEMFPRLERCVLQGDCSRITKEDVSSFASGIENLEDIYLESSSGDLGESCILDERTVWINRIPSWYI